MTPYAPELERDLLSPPIDSVPKHEKMKNTFSIQAFGLPFRPEEKITFTVKSIILISVSLAGIQTHHHLLDAPIQWIKLNSGL